MSFLVGRSKSVCVISFFYTFLQRCYAMGRNTVLVPKALEERENAVTGVMKYLWWGYVLSCPHHGVVYRSRAHWSGNPPPEDSPLVHWQVVHLWPGETSLLQVNNMTVASNSLSLLNLRC